ncbi:UNVERIFIED_CONTAM: hypothetical protein FKN15_056366 [Acipenser sinensis]
MRDFIFPEDKEAMSLWGKNVLASVASILNFRNEKEFQFSLCIFMEANEASFSVGFQTGVNGEFETVCKISE